MQLLGPHTLYANEFLPFTTIITNWANAGSQHLITYDESSKHFLIPYASSNDYLILWFLELKTALSSEYPILGLEFLYENRYRCDYLIAPAKTIQLSNSALYHIPAASTSDLLSIGLKVVGETNESYTLASVSNCNITANISILGL